MERSLTLSGLHALKVELYTSGARTLTEVRFRGIRIFQPIEDLNKQQKMRQEHRPQNCISQCPAESGGGPA